MQEPGQIPPAKQTVGADSESGATADPGQRVLDSLPVGAYLCTADGRLTRWNQEAVRVWGRTPPSPDSHGCYCGAKKAFTAGGTPLEPEELPAVAALRSGQRTAPRELLIEQPSGQRVTVLAQASPLKDEQGEPTGSMTVLLDITSRKRTEQAVQQLNETLEFQIAERTSSLQILHDVTVAANQSRTVDQAVAATLRRICVHNAWALGHAWRRAEDAPEQLVSSGVWYPSSSPTKELREFRRVTELTRIPIGSGFVGRVARTGQPYWLDDVDQFLRWRRQSPSRFGLRSAIAFPVLVNDEVAAVLEFFSHDRIQRAAGFMEIMPDVGIQLGHVYKRRRLEKTIADKLADQQRRISLDLHDGVSQLLTGVAMMGESLRQVLEDEESPHHELADKLVRFLREAQRQVQRVSRGLMPVERDAESLMKALEQLVEQAEQLYDIPCAWRCDSRVPVTDEQVSTQLYFIASEAIHNAAKHAAPSNITVLLERRGPEIRLVVEDDGEGTVNHTEGTGMGLSIMQHRAGLIDAKLVHKSGPQGTRLTCTVPIDRAKLPTS